MREGFLIGGGLVVTGLMLEMSVGPVVWDMFRWPVNIIFLAISAILMIGVFLLRKRVFAFRFIATAAATVPALSYALALTIIMGLTRQTVDGVWINNMLTFWPFVLIYTYIAVILAQVILRRLSVLRSMRDWPFLLNHLGLLIAMVCATLGNADMRRMKMITSLDGPEWRAFGENGEIRELPIAVELRRFIMETYDDGSPRRFASDVTVMTESGKCFDAVVDVNHPVEVDGWMIYQYGYDTLRGTDGRISILELVHDPWLPYVYAGIIMMLAGALCMFVTGVRRRKK